MDSVKLLNKIHNNTKLCNDIIYYYERTIVQPTKTLTSNAFVKIMTKHHIDIHPSILFNFFDSVKIKITTFPVGKTDFWGSKIYFEDNVLVSNDYSDRNEATLGAIETAINIFNSKTNNTNNTNTKKNDNK